MCYFLVVSEFSTFDKLYHCYKILNMWLKISMFYHFTKTIIEKLSNPISWQILTVNFVQK